MKIRFTGAALIIAASILAFGTATLIHGQSAPNTEALKEQLRQRYDFVALHDGLGLVPRQHEDNIELIAIRNGAVGNAVSAAEARKRLGDDAETILRLTYLDASAQRDFARENSQANQEEGTDDQTAVGGKQTRHGDVVRIGGNVTVARDEVATGDVVVIGGSAEINGEVTGDATVIGGALTLGPEAIVRRDVAVVGGSLNRSPTAQIYGTTNNVAVGAELPFNRPLGHDFGFRRRFARTGGLLGAILRVTLLILGALIVVALGGRFVEAIAARAAAEPLRAGLAGLLTEILFVPLIVITVVVLAVSIIGIPLLILVPFGVVMVLMFMFVGFTGTATLVGRLVSNRLGVKPGPYATVAMGVLAVAALALIGKIMALAGSFAFGLVIAGPITAAGYLAEYLAWTIGCGAVILTWLNGRQRGPTANIATQVTGGTHE